MTLKVPVRPVFWESVLKIINKYLEDSPVITTMAYKGHAANIKENTQIKKKTRKQKRKHANKKENTQTKKETRK